MLHSTTLTTIPHTPLAQAYQLSERGNIPSTNIRKTLFLKKVIPYTLQFIHIVDREHKNHNNLQDSFSGTVTACHFNFLGEHVYYLGIT